MATLHGKNGVVYMGENTATQITELTEWHISIDRDLAEDTVMGDSWRTQLKGIISWSGSFAGYMDTASNDLFTAATGANKQRIYIYPDANNSTAYYYGYCWPNLTIDATLGDVVAVSCDFDGDGVLSKNP